MKNKNIILSGLLLTLISFSNAEYIMSHKIDSNIIDSMLVAEHTIPKSCFEVLNNNSSATDGVYSIDPYETGAFNVYCDMTTDGGGWTLVAWNKGATLASQLPTDLMARTYNTSLISLKDNYPARASSINSELMSKTLNTQDVMLKSDFYSTNPIIENNNGNWDYNVADCSGILGHTSRTSGCSNHNGNDNYNANDAYNIAIYLGNKAIVPAHYNMGNELCWSGGGVCDFEFYIR